MRVLLLFRYQVLIDGKNPPDEVAGFLDQMEFDYARERDCFIVDSQVNIDDVLGEHGLVFNRTYADKREYRI
ncbi:MAG: hypothetical protein HY367_02400 [Candidatus Aenigmarchaeota archaeon]|nr:hypothetical protein [Candidatus Aenigmarchaeota archaeon]